MTPRSGGNHEAHGDRFTSTRRVVTTVYICNKIAVYIRVDAGSMPSARGDRSFFLLAQIKKIRALLLIFYRDLDMMFQRKMNGTSVFSVQFWVGKGMGRFFSSLDLMFGVQNCAHFHCENSDS